MEKLSIATFRADNVPGVSEDELLIVSELDINKCRGCLRCRQLGQCAWFNDDAARLAPVVASASHLDFYLQKDGNLSLLLNRVLFAMVKAEGKSYTLHIEDNAEQEYVSRLLDWCGYTKIAL